MQQIAKAKVAKAKEQKRKQDNISMSRKKDNKLQILELTDIAYATAMFTMYKEI